MQSFPFFFSGTTTIGDSQVASSTSCMNPTANSLSISYFTIVTYQDSFNTRLDEPVVDLGIQLNLIIDGILINLHLYDNHMVINCSCSNTCFGNNTSYFNNIAFLSRFIHHREFHQFQLLPNIFSNQMLFLATLPNQVYLVCKICRLISSKISSMDFNQLGETSGALATRGDSTKLASIE